MASTYFDLHGPSHHELVHVVASDLLNQECPDGYTAHIVDDSHLQGATGELTVSRHVVVSKVVVVWVVASLRSSSVLSSSSTDASLPQFCNCHQDPLR